MKFAGLQKISLVDFPQHLACVLFTPGCNLRCPFCHNWRIVLDPRPPFLNEETAVKILEERKQFVDAVVITGGEPTIHRELPNFLKKLKERGFTLKLDTNGFNPEVLKECLPYVDYVALDVKTSLEKYELLGAKSTANFLRTLESLKTAKIQYEFRMTVVPGFVDIDDITRTGELLKGAEILALQQFVPGDTLDKSFNNVKPYPRETFLRFAEAMKHYVNNVVLRV